MILGGNSGQLGWAQVSLARVEGGRNTVQLIMNTVALNLSWRIDMPSYLIQMPYHHIYHTHVTYGTVQL